MSRKQFANVTAPDPELLVLLEKQKGKPAGSGKFAKSDKGAIEQQANTRPARPEAGPDNEVWVRDRVMTAMRMVLALATLVGVGADEPAFEHAFRGIAEGTSIEILGTLGFDIDKLYNLRRVHRAQRIVPD